MSRPEDAPPLAPFALVGSVSVTFGLGLLVGGTFGSDAASVPIILGGILVVVMIGIALYRAGRGDYD